ncbi:alpha/beta hydrolase [Solihabitans fulvus]|uniref:Alpha/beta hydrolase n=1 Tax=Solihabitans fulvus TaxID=1892852 RepID=A0A5B2XT09_9PSEU|nr:alpha/beta hydrolase [Solihabitans fulvus]KAA2267048.1 alpha/beta hydrolase [Solihabitans fulvus]
MGYAEGIETFVDLCNEAMPPDFYTYPVEEQRRLYLGLTKVFPYPVPDGVAVRDAVVRHDGRDLPVRVYEPGTRSGAGLAVYLRGGGFVVGSLDTHNTVVAELAARSGLVTVAPDFRMSPEHPFPAALEDCFGALSAIVTRPAALGVEIDTDAVVLCGDSSGANMAVTVSMMCRDRGGPTLRGQGLISPVLDFTRWRHGGADAPLLTGGEMEYYTKCYCAEPEQAADPYVSPLVSGSFHDLPPAYIMSAELDSLRVDAEQYTEHLRRNGIAVRNVVEPGLVHAAVRARALSPQVEDAWARFCAAVALLAEQGEPDAAR